MESNETSDTSEVLIKLARLEDQVAELSSQLEVNKMTIVQLKQSLIDRDSQISELEAKLIIAQNSLQYKTSAKLFQTREKLVNGSDANLINTLLGHIQNYIEIVRQLVNETEAFIRQKYCQVLENFKIAINFLQQVPGQTNQQIQSRIVEPTEIFIKKAVQYADDNYQIGREWLEKQVVDPSLAVLDSLAFLARELPLNTKIILQTRVIEPALSYLEKSPVMINSVWVELSVWIKNLMIRLRQLIQQFWKYIKEQITHSSFWDGKHHMNASAA